MFVQTFQNGHRICCDQLFTVYLVLAPDIKPGSKNKGDYWQLGIRLLICWQCAGDPFDGFVNDVPDMVSSISALFADDSNRVLTGPCRVLEFSVFWQSP